LFEQSEFAPIPFRAELIQFIDRSPWSVKNLNTLSTEVEVNCFTRKRG
jgi:hypothetical protein